MKINIIIHNHQPVGNFKHIFEDAYNKAYKPLLDILEKYKNIKLNLHYTGPLIDWLSRNRIAFIDQLGRLIENGQVELIGGPYYEPILSNLREADILGQISLAKTRYKKFFGKIPRGLWVPELVWEQALITPLAEMGLNYTMLSEEFFRRAGVTDELINGYYLTERTAKNIAVFPLVKSLGKDFLSLELDNFVQKLDNFADENYELLSFSLEGEKLGVYGDSFEKFIQNGFIDRLFSKISKSTKLETGLISESLTEFSPKKMLYFPSMLREELSEWAIHARLVSKYSDLKDDLIAKDKSLINFIIGGFWENFLTKYRESNLLHKRLVHVSARLEKFEDMIEKRTVNRIKEHLYKAQSNTAYWYAGNGGIYVPYLRSALFQNLILAESLLDMQLSKFGDPYGIRIEDFDGDRKDEVIYSSVDYAVFLGLHYGSILELDNRSVGINVVNLIKRRKELTHSKLVLKLDNKKNKDKILVSKDLLKELIYDKYPRDVGLVHIVPQDTGLEELKSQSYQDLFKYKKFKLIARSKRYVILEAKGYLDISGQKIPLVVQKKYRFLKKGIELVISTFLEEELSIDLMIVVESNFNLMMSSWGKDLEKKTSKFSIYNEYFSYGIKYNIETTDTIDKVKLIGYEVNTVNLVNDKADLTYQGTSLNYLVPVSLRPDKITELTLGIYFT